MNVHQFTRGFWEHEPSLSLGCNKRLRSLVVPKLSNNTDNITTTTPNSFDLKSFIRPECAFRNISSSEDNKKDPPLQQGQAETHPAGGTRWNPTQEQIGILEMLYKGGMRTPNAQQIEQITVQLSNYGKIEGKNVFYWFQNHKARERQKQKRNGTLGFVHSSPRSTTTVSSTFSSLTTTLETPKRGELEVMEIRDQGNSPLKKCRSWPFEYLEDQSWLMYKEEEHKTLELFPLHPESR